MAKRVFLHIGLPKTGTTYLQTIMWADRERLRSQGLLLPGRERRDHLWSSRIIRDDPRMSDYGPRAPQAWDTLVAEINDFDGSALISHEFFAAASTDQAERMVSRLAAAGDIEPHLILTAREPVGLFAGGWQEALKNRDTRTMAEFAAAPVSADPRHIWNWRTLDLRLVLERWAPLFAADRVHVVVMPGPGEPREELWRRFATLVGLDAASFDLSVTFPNPSMGIVEAETLRRINQHLQVPDFDRAFDRGVYLRTFLADERLATRAGERYLPGPEVVAECRRRAEAAVAAVRSGGYAVHGDLSLLLVPEELPPRRTPESVTDAEVAEVATELAARLLRDVRELSEEGRDRQQRPVGLPTGGLRAAVADRFPTLRRLVRRVR